MIRMVALLALLSAAPAAAAPPRDRWFAPDKVKHFLMSAFIQSSAFSAARGAKVSRSNAQFVAGISSAAFGIGKEIHDRRKWNQFSAKDLLWDGAGALTAAALLNGTR